MNTAQLEEVKTAARNLSQVSEKQKNLFLQVLSDVMLENKNKILSANRRDIKRALQIDMKSSFIQRLTLSEGALISLANRLIELKKITCKMHEILEETHQENILLQKVRTPLGIIAVIYEARPEVTVDVVALCIKSSNAVILKGGSEGSNTISVFIYCIQKALQKTKINTSVITSLSSSKRSEIHELITNDAYIDLVIARGGYAMVREIMNKSSIPVLAHAAGGARIYIDKSANLSLVEEIIINAKTSKPAACNSLDTIVVHTDIAGKALPLIYKICKSYGIEVVKNIWDQEFLDLKLSIKIVKDHNEAITFMNTYSKNHSEGIIAQDEKVIETFTKLVDAAALFVNSSTRNHDGYAFGLGAEIGIATGKLHARGPVGLNELTSYKWIAYGN